MLAICSEVLAFHPSRLRAHFVEGRELAVAGVGATPGVEGIQDGAQGLAQGGEGVFHFGGHLGVNLAVDEVIPFQFPELLGEHFLGDAGEGPMQFPEAAGAAKQFVQNQHFPAPPNPLEGEFHRTFRQGLIGKFLRKGFGEHGGLGGLTEGGGFGEEGFGKIGGYGAFFATAADFAPGHQGQFLPTLHR